MIAVGINMRNNSKSFGNSELFATFVSKNSWKLLDPSLNIFNTAYKAGFLRRFYASSFGCSSKHPREVSLFCYFFTSNSSSMKNSKNLKTVAQSASTSTVRTRNRTSVCVESAQPTPKNIYRVELHGFSIYNLGGSSTRTGIFHADNYEAASDYEAMGIAISVVKAKFRTYYIDSSLTKITHLNPLVSCR